MASRTRITTTIDLKGPFFTKRPGKTFRQNGRVMLAAIAAEGQEDVRAQLRAGESHRAPIAALGGHVSAHVVGRVTSLRGKAWQVTAVVAVNNTGFTKKQGTSLMAAAARVERQTGAFRRTAGRLRRSRKVNAAELLRGIDE